MIRWRPPAKGPIVKRDVTRVLTPGTVVAIKTRHGHYAKMRIDSYGYSLGITSTTYQ